MNINREHLAGLNYALSTVPTWSDRAAWLRDLIAQAQAAPEAESVACEVEIPDIAATFDGLYLVPIRPLQRGDHLMTVAQHNRIMAAAPQHDTELIELLRGLVAIAEKKSRGRTGSPNHGHSVPGVWDSDNGELAGKSCAECAIYDHARAKLATLSAKNEGGTA